MKVAILTTLDEWFVPNANELNQKVVDASLFFDHKEIDATFDIVFILGYHKIIEKEYLKRHKHNIIIHESALPQGKGWAPLFWQILEGKDAIPFTMLEASDGIDKGDIYMQKILKLNGHELNKELRKKQAELTIEMCLEFLNNYEQYKNPKKQKGEESFYPKRTFKDSELNMNNTIEEQFNLLRIVDNDKYPAFFYKNGHKYKLTIDKVEEK